MQRLLAGRPVGLDGQTLAVDTQLTLRLQRVAREAAAETLPIPQGRGGDRAPERAGRRAASRSGRCGRCRSGSGRGRLYVPTAVAGDGPLLVFFHGGGYMYGDLDSHDAPCRFLAERAGVRVLSVDYRLAPEQPFPAAYDDAVAAYRWVVEQRRVRSAPTRRGSPSAATPPAPAWPPAWRWRRRARGCRWPSSCWSTRRPTPRGTRRAGGCSARGSS